MTEFGACAVLGVRHGFFTRRGGVSGGAFASLNCSLSSPDDPALVAENRARAARAIGCDPARLVGVTQVHGVETVHVTSVTARSAWPRADAMVASGPEVVLGIVTADCAPVLFADATANVVGAAHAGWRGAVAGVLEATVEAMLRLGAQRDRIHAAVGPCIGASSYEVGSDLRQAVLDAGNGASFFAPGLRPDRWWFDLRGYCRSRLSASIGQVDDVDGDTLAEETRFFSHRRRTLRGEGSIGHQLSVISAQAA